MENKSNEKQNRAKIIVSSEDELTDLLRKIAALDDSNVLLTFAEESDLLISPINLKSLQEVCDELGKNIILQIIQNPAGVRNAQKADIITTESPSDVDEDLWVFAEKKRKERVEKRKELLKNQTPNKTQDAKEAIQSLDEGDSTGLQDSEYQSRVQQVIEKSKGIIEHDQKSVIQDEDLTFAIGQDIEEQEAKKEPQEETENEVEDTKIAEDKKTKEEKTHSNEKKVSLTDKNLNKPEDLKKKKVKKEKKPKTPQEKGKLKKKIILITVLILGILAVSGVFAYNTLPTVNAKIFLETKSIEVEKELEGNTDIENLDLEAGKIPVRKEEVIVSRSDHADTTGTGTRGSRAEGLVNLKYWDGDETTIPSGTKIITDGLEFEITTDVQMSEAPTTETDISVRATDPGDEYNLSSGQLFTVEGFDEDSLTAENNDSFSGGDSEEYPELTQEDYDNLKDSLKEEAIEEARRDLEEKNPDWEILEDSIEETLDGNVETDIGVGDEGDMFNMSLQVKVTGLFFNREEIIDSKEEIIKQAAEEEGLFKTGDDLELELDDDIEMEVNVTEIGDENIEVEFTAKGYVRVELNTENLKNSLAGESWEEGKNILENIEFSEKEPEIEFGPEYFPEFLWHFPTNTEQINIETELIETETVQPTEEEEDN